MTTFVLLHGAWHGGWCWSRVAPLLRDEGHRVFAPTFTGLGDRAHLVSPAVDLSTHIDDVVRLLDAEGLTEVVLVGHSYAGMVLSGVAGARPEALRLRVYLDAFVPGDGESAISLLPEPVAAHYRESVRDRGFGWLIPPRSLEVLGVTDSADLEWLSPRLTPQPWGTYREPVALSAAANRVPAAYVECTDWLRVFAAQADRGRRRGWDVHEIATGHEAMVTAPEELSALLLRLT
ncbi:alpha/beta fold hydrolase [Lentzea sp. NPDC059081]|uniref:alpha/beta fold hydrolase n=1 Tax=Lentzea sp. NPDC059081 TaxID=3346719 RepID=UPI0036A3F82D